MPSTEHLKFDVRLIRRNVRDGRINEQQLKEHLDALKDMAGKFDIIEVSTDPDEGFHRPRPDFDSRT